MNSWWISKARTNSSTAARSCAEKLGESAVTESACLPSARCAAQAKYAESAPPESAMIKEPASARRARREVSFCSGERPELSGMRIGTNAVIRNQYNAELRCIAALKSLGSLLREMQ